MLAPSLVAPATPTFSDGHFIDQIVFSGLTQPTTVRFAADGRAFVAEKSGLIKEFDSLSDTTPTVVADLRIQTDDYWDRGLLSLAIDPGFLTGKPYLYAYLVYDAPPGQTAPVWNDTCPSPPGATTDGCVATSELVRLTIDLATNVSTAQDVLIHDWCQQFPSHAGGALTFDSAGNLIVTGGEGANFSGIDYGQRGGTLPSPSNPVTPVDPCGDPTHVTLDANGYPVTDTATAEGGSLRAQDVRTTSDPTGLDGTIIRVDPATGVGVAGNPLASSADPNNRRLIATGFRNPFRMTTRPGTNELYVGDVGDQTWEEIDLVNPPTTALTPTTLPDYGWPCYEGAPKSGWQWVGTNMCTNLYNQPNAVTAPLYAYSHTNTLAPVGPCFVPDSSGRMDSAVTGLAFYEGASAGSLAYPSKYTGALFFVDYSRNCLGALLPGSNGVPDPSTMEQVASGLSHPVDLLTGAGGDLYYVDLDGGAVHRISYHTDPVAAATVTPSMFLAPGMAHLDGSGSTNPDPGNPIVAYDWYLNGQTDVSGAPDATGQTYDWAITTPGVYPVTLKVVTALGLTSTAKVTVDASDAPPTPVIDTPSGSLTWSVGDTISFSGHATDGHGNAMDPSTLSWELVIHHCPGGCHLHFIQNWSGVSGASFIAPDHQYPSYLELRLTATDSHGATASTSVDLQPNTATLTVGASLPDVAVSVDGVTRPNPSTLTYIRGGTATVSAPIRVTSGGKPYRFSRWTDNVGAVHDVVVNPGTAITAQYVPDAPDQCAAATTTSPSGPWISDYLSGNGDQDWFRFSLTSTRRVLMTAGNLPADAKLELFSACGTLLASSDHPGNRFEQITRVLRAGTYRLLVVGMGGARGDTPYVVRFRPLPSGLPVLSAHLTRSGSRVRLVGELMNNTGVTKGRVTVTATFVSSTGRVVATLRGLAFADRLGNGAVTSFQLSGSVPTYAAVRYSLSAARAVSGPSLRITSLTYTPGPGGTTLERGVVKNVGTRTARLPAIARTWYGALGQVLDVGWAAASVSSLAPGRSASFTVTRPAGLTTLQATATQWRAVL
ncbi:MAG: PQQ-dependent sugar dehydrogenase [Candidatus Limnocylindrales bacterium]